MADNADNVEMVEDFKKLSDILETGKSISVKNAEIGEIIVSAGETGKSGYGLKHIIEGRYKKDKKSETDISSLLYLVVETAKNGKNKPELLKGTDKYAIENNGIIAIISKSRRGKDEHFIITGYELNDKKTEATEAIQAVSAKYGYTPEFSGFRKQVGAVIASLGGVSHNSDNSSSPPQSVRA
jgi:hypothetical protein